MRKAALISAAASAVIGYAAVHFAFFATPEPTVAPEVPAAETAAEPVLLADVVEVTDTDVLLEARATEAEGTPFDPQVVPASFGAPAKEVPPIPPADETEEPRRASVEVEVAPLPHAGRVRS
ncbi:hypothetical protein GobsT_00940 [Gemmata obscuriglobus]|uniref:Energy transducer TonB n=1 Tax=Gemmata obscuriglobus TaxID=114 RepID=A0A2Z3H5I5_9BACT|nr:hypothetical protein [Gemmata obscuriglobus]AWM41283.1 hypothetical protein C1280_32675 [Gemmata obscuriglobus]QEG25369.1 hypothetical protein GobsT_00940 [Gemmata obscuriglobus]VTR98369.1 unnamed protein product [Gemmata obscuriglobus UQM 2246]